MSCVLRIANIFFEIKDKRFPDILGPAERKLLKPFLLKRLPHKMIGQKEHIKVRIIYIDDLGPEAPLKPEISTLKKIRTIFPRDLIRENRGCLQYLFSKDSKLRPAIPGIRNIMRRNANIYMVVNIKLAVVFDKASRNCTVFIRESIINNPRSAYRFYFLKFLLRVVLGSDSEGALFHASSIGVGGRGHIFIGRSGSGKTTMTELLNSRDILSDDMTIIKRDRERYMAYSTPWQNMNKPSLSVKPYEVGGLFFIKKGKKTVLKRITYIESLRRTIREDASLRRTMFTLDKRCIANYYQFVSSLLKEKPAFLLHVKKDPSFDGKFKRFTHLERLVF
jgi:hypothetical protein